MCPRSLRRTSYAGRRHPSGGPGQRHCRPARFTGAAGTSLRSRLSAPPVGGQATGRPPRHASLCFSGGARPISGGATKGPGHASLVAKRAPGGSPAAPILSRALRLGPIRRLIVRGPQAPRLRALPLRKMRSYAKLAGLSFPSKALRPFGAACLPQAGGGKNLRPPCGLRRGRAPFAS